jgi:hypothetical protein
MMSPNQEMVGDIGHCEPPIMLGASADREFREIVGSAELMSAKMGPEALHPYAEQKGVTEVPG